MWLHDRFVVLVKIERQEVVFEEQFELIYQEIALLLRLCLCETQVEADLRAEVEC